MRGCPFLIVQGIGMIQNGLGPMQCQAGLDKYIVQGQRSAFTDYRG